MDNDDVEPNTVDKILLILEYIASINFHFLL